MTLMSMSISVFAQFYDSDDEVRIYVQKSSYDNPGNYPSIMVFNFNGAKAAKLDVNGERYLKMKTISRSEYSPKGMKL